LITQYELQSAIFDLNKKIVEYGYESQQAEVFIDVIKSGLLFNKRKELAKINLEYGKYLPFDMEFKLSSLNRGEYVLSIVPDFKYKNEDLVTFIINKDYYGTAFMGRWWQNGGYELWNLTFSGEKGFREGEITVSSNIAESFLAKAEKIEGWEINNLPFIVR